MPIRTPDTLPPRQLRTDLQMSIQVLREVLRIVHEDAVLSTRTCINCDGEDRPCALHRRMLRVLERHTELP